MRVLRPVVLLFIAGLILAAPMLCVRFCELQRHLARPQISLAEMARRHALSLSERQSQHSHHHNRSDDHAPLARLKQMVNSVSEFLLALAVAIGTAAVALRFTAPALHLDQPVLSVPKPPPRFSTKLAFAS